VEASDAADVVIRAFAAKRLIPLLSDADLTLDEAGAYAIAREVHTRRVRRGERPVGRKIGFTNRAIWSQYGVTTPIWGHMYDTTVHHVRHGGARVDVSRLVQPRIEPEIQLHFGRMPPVTRDVHAILECVDWIAQGFEIVQCPFAQWSFKGVDAVAAFGVHGALVVGTPVAVADIEDCAHKLGRFTIELWRDGAPQSAGGGANVLGSPLLAFAHLAEVLSRQSLFPAVQADEIVSTGTLTDLLPVAPGETWSTRLDGIDLPGLTTVIA